MAPQNSIEKAINITAAFEGSRGYTAIAGDFDGAGLSMGIFQFNAGSHTLQPILRATLAAIGHERAKEIFGNDDLYILNKRLSDGNAVFHQWAKSLSYRNDKGHVKVKDPWYGRFVKLLETPECQEAQRAAMAPYVNKAKRIMEKYGFKSERAFCLALDIAVQNGSVTGRANEQYTARVTPGMNELAKLHVMAQAVGDSALPRWRQDVLSRKQTIVRGEGTVHGKRYRLDISNNPAIF